ncbi:MAG: c-type cytochrome [bacterium]|nr:c-type cytochrome [bacterium]
MCGTSYLRVALVLLVLPVAAQAQDATDELGQQVYTKWCAHCHGEEGDGNGVAASRLKPLPRDFTSGKYKIRMTTTGNIPTDQDLTDAIRRGLYGTSMPAFTAAYLSDAEVAAVVGYIKSFSDWFEDPERQNPETITIPDPPPYDPEAARTTGRQVYEETGCARCHGELGRGDGPSAPTLVDDWGNNIKVADLTMPWTFRGGGTRRDIFRSMSTGFYGTPMPGFHDNLGATPEESQQRMWAIVDYMLSLAGGPMEEGETPYANVLRSVPFGDEIDLENAELFAEAPPATFPLFGQIVEPGRNFYPSAVAVTAQAVHSESEIAFRLTWNDMRAETGGTNGPDLIAPKWDEHLAEIGQAGAASGDTDEGGDFWGEEATEDDEGGDFWGAEEEEAADEGGGDFWGEEAAEEDADGDDFWGEEDGAEEAPLSGTLDTEFSDAFALQFPLQKPEGVRQPYFLFGDAQNPVDLWFVDLAKPSKTVRYQGRGSAAMSPAEGGEDVEVVAGYDQGEWSVIFKRKRKSRGGLSFDEDSFLPIAFSVWDGFNRERGNKRGLSSWYQVYVEPSERPSPVGPMVRAGATVLGLELLFIALVRRRKGKKNS